MHESTKNELNKIKEKLYSDLYAARKDNDVLKEQISRLEKDKKSLEATVIERNEQMLKDKADYQVQL